MTLSAKKKNEVEPDFTDSDKTILETKGDCQTGTETQITEPIKASTPSVCKDFTSVPRHHGSF